MAAPMYNPATSDQISEWVRTEKSARAVGHTFLADTIHQILSSLLHERFEAYTAKCQAAGATPGPAMFPDGWTELL